ncbi:chorismate mutase [Thermocatellispora tengchongensis]|uniref:Chorismate mutase n=1 Tax=Thermocatellispora tengchongensis TaxID=1073253 RepID=A0A840NY75_9ACTN|nr:chorismate mutase [Thermocatellispora tengchongensis]
MPIGEAMIGAPGEAVIVAPAPDGGAAAADPGADGRPDVGWITMRAPGSAGALEAARRHWAGPLLVEPSSPADLAAIRETADGVIVGAAWTRDLVLVRASARLGLPVIVQRGPHASLGEWLATVRECEAEGNDLLVLCETGGRAHDGSTAPDLGLMRAARERSGRPVLAGLGEDAGLAGAAVAAGADGLVLAPGADGRTAAAARRTATLVRAVTAPLDGPSRPGSVAAARAEIDRVDAALATLLERRAELAGVVQRLKPVGGFAGRDMERERRLVAAMARHAPRLGEARLAAIMNAVIEAGLDLSEEERRASP